MTDCVRLAAISAAGERLVAALVRLDQVAQCLADTVIRCATAYSMAASRAIYQAVAVRDDQIVAVSPDRHGLDALIEEKQRAEMAPEEAELSSPTVPGRDRPAPPGKGGVRAVYCSFPPLLSSPWLLSLPDGINTRPCGAFKFGTMAVTNPVARSTFANSFRLPMQA